MVGVERTNSLLLRIQNKLFPDQDLTRDDRFPDITFVTSIRNHGIWIAPYGKEVRFAGERLRVNAILSSEPTCGPLERSANARKVADLVTYLATSFAVRPHEVAIMRVQGRLLRFVAPLYLVQSGAIPLSSGAIAARTANTLKEELFNNFASVRHASVFENVKFATNAADPHRSENVIQKLMSCPLIDKGVLVGVVQISRKAASRTSAGADFTPEELSRLRQMCTAIASEVRQLA